MWSKRASIRVGVICAIFEGLAGPAYAVPIPEVLEPTSSEIDFGSVPIDTPSAMQHVRIRNIGDATASVIEIRAFEPCHFSGPASARLAPGQEAAWDVWCQPTEGGQRFAYFVLTWCDSTCEDVDTRLTFDLSVHGGYFDEVSGPGLIGYADEHVRQALSLHNHEAFPLTVTALNASPPFAATLASGTLPATVPVGGNLDLVIEYDASAGDGSSLFDVVSGTQTIGRVPLTGFQRTQIQPARDGFDVVPRGAVYTRPTTIHNASAFARTITSASFDLPDFTIGNVVGRTLAPHETIAALVTLSATTLGSRDATLTLAFDSGQGATAELLATVVAPTFTATSDDATPNDGWLDFGTVRLADGPVERTLTIRNVGATAIPILLCIAAAPPFAFVAPDPCPSSIPANTSLTITVRLTPTVVGEVGSSVGAMVTSLGEIRSPVRARVIAGAYAPSVPEVTFVDVMRATSSQQTLAIANQLDTPVTVPIAVTGDAFALVTASPLVIAARGTAEVTVAFTPPAAGEYAGALVVGDVTDPDRIEVPLAGTAVAPNVSVDSAVDLGAVAIGDVATRTLTFANLDATHGLELDRLDVTGAGFTAEVADPVVAPGGSAAITIRFSPLTEGAASGQLAIVLRGDPTPIAVVQLSATGVAPEEPPPPSDDGGCCQGSPAGGAPVLAALVLLVLRRSRR
ncbi:MAG TPA: choice-of-anchor D domain-containing protein [Kofleriaceae bacterium]|nr:choice-of-anchor D domain-containing protein [Kofleriaceae bacterium]